MIKELIEKNCIKIGNFTLKNGETSKYYFDMKNIISYPSLLKSVGDQIYKKLGDFDIICGIPYGGLPIATYISTRYNKPLIFIRDKLKDYGTQKQIEGEFKKSDKCVIIDDVITTGKSLQNAIDILKDKITIVDTIVIFDRQQGHNCSMPIKSLFYKNDIIKYRLNEIKKKKKSNLCFSADIQDIEKLKAIINTIGKHIVICKIHYDIIDNKREKYKKELIDLSIKHDFLIMEDRKFNDISYIVEKQYKNLANWIDLVTVHTLVSKDVLNLFPGIMLVANMSNNDYDYSDKALSQANNNPNTVVGFITQKRIKSEDFISMTPGVSIKTSQNKDQKYRDVRNIDADIIIVGRALYNSTNLLQDINNFI